VAMNNRAITVDDIADDEILSYHIALDPAKKQDYSALALIGELPLSDPTQPKKPFMAVRGLYRWPLGTDYDEITADVLRLAQDPRLVVHRQLTNKWGDKVWTETNLPSLVVDATGVGEPVAEILNQPHLNLHEFCAVTIVGGEKQKYESGSWHVPRMLLLSGLEASLRRRDFKVPDNLDLVPVMVEELQNFRRKQAPETGRISYEAFRESDHDDTIFACAIGAWSAQRRAYKRSRPFVVGSFRGY
jgi:hypothetical protein